MASPAWCQLLCKSTELQLKGTLNGGQSFRWKKTVDDEFPGREKWIGVFNNRVWQLIQEDDHILYKVHETETDGSLSKQVQTKHDVELKNYFRLDLNLKEYYEKWSEADAFFKEASKKFYGIRILSQDIVENLFSFICSSNNNISRISSMVEKMCTLYGRKICEIEGKQYYTFPNVESLARPDVEKSLREAGFGYRAGFISKTAKSICEAGSDEWFKELKSLNYFEARKKLTTLTGVGAKVADCICLMSLGHLESVPVDTHVYQIAARYYLEHLGKRKTVTEKIYNEIGDHFRELYGPLAGWAHTVLFCADLKQFRNPDDAGKEKRARKRKKEEQQ